MSEQSGLSESKQDAPASELDRRKQGLSDWVEQRVIGKKTNIDVEATNAYAEFSTREKAEVLYSKLMAYKVADRIIREEEKDNPEVEPDDPYLIGEIKGLWEDDQTRDMFVSRFAEARLDAKVQRSSELGAKWKDINERIAQTREVYEAGARQLFLKQLKRPDQISAAQGRTQRFARELIKLHQEKDAVIHLEGLSPTHENTDIAAGIMYDTLVKYHDQAEQGFVWLPSREQIHEQTIASLQNGRWPVLRGETGTGKSDQADAAAVALTGEQPTHIGSDPTTSSRELIADRDIDSVTGGSYETYGAAMQAATGYEDSRQEEPTHKTGRVVRFDESGRLGPKAYSVIKDLGQKRPVSPEDLVKVQKGESINAAKMLHGRPVLPGFSAIFATNPEGVRYPDRTEPDPALRREFHNITVDYPEMTAENPELYEFMLATLMDENNHIPVAKQELAPSYSNLRNRDHNETTLPDGRKIIRRKTLKRDPTYEGHGSLYRLAFAIRSVQDTFNQWNMKSLPESALRYNTTEDGKLQIVENGGDPLTLATSTITLGEVASWMKGFHERRRIDDPTYQVDTLTEWIQVKLKGYLGQVDEDDREKVAAIFEHYHLFDAPELKDEQPILPKEIGYLSPRVPRPVEVAPLSQEEVKNQTTDQTDQELYEDISCVLENGEVVMATAGPLDIEKFGRTLHLTNGKHFFMGRDRFNFVGFAPDKDKVVVQIDTLHEDEALYKVIDVEDLKEQLERDPRTYELVQETKDKLRERFGKEFEVSLPPQELFDVWDRAIEKKWHNLDAQYLPDIKLEEDGDYPEGWIELEENFYNMVREGKLPPESIELGGRWVLVDMTDPADKSAYGMHDPLKPLINKLRREGAIPEREQYWDPEAPAPDPITPVGPRFDIPHDVLESTVIPAIDEELEAGESGAKVRSLRAVESNFLRNLDHLEFGTQDMLLNEWLDDRVESNCLRTSNVYPGVIRIVDGALSYLNPLEQISFRPIIEFSKRLDV